MSRARNIKPGFFKNDVLAECEPLARILFAGLWCEADRAGRLEERPKRLKADVLPYDDCDIESLLDQLEKKGFIIRYDSGGVRYIAVPEFSKHQNPHKNETASTIPAPFLHSTSTVQEQDGTNTTPSSLETKIDQGIDENSSNRADSLSLDCSSLIPSSLTESVSVCAGEIAQAGQPVQGADRAIIEPAPNVQAVMAMIAAGVPARDCNAQHADLVELIAAGCQPSEFGAAAGHAAGMSPPRLEFAYVLGIAKRRHAQKILGRQVATGSGWRKPSVTDSFENRSYTDTPDDQLSPELRDEPVRVA